MQMIPKDPEFDARVRQSFGNQSMMETLGARIQIVQPGMVEIHTEVWEGVLQQQGFAHGGLAFSIGDSAAGYSALSLQRADREVLTVEMKINYLSPGAGSLMIAKGRVIRAGRNIIAVAADVFTQEKGHDPVQIAALQGTIMSVNH